MKFFYSLVMSTAAIVAITGCGGGGGSSTTTVATAPSLTAVDGYIKDADVLADINTTGGAGVLNTYNGEPEPTTTTDSNGDFSFGADVEIPNGTIVYVSGGIDIASGRPFEGRLKGIYNGSDLIVSPLTTMVTTLVESGTSASDATAQVATALGITEAEVSADPMQDAEVFFASQTVMAAVEVMTTHMATPADATEQAAQFDSVINALTSSDMNYTSAATTLITAGAIVDVASADDIAAQVEVVETLIDEVQTLSVSADTVDLASYQTLVADTMDDVVTQIESDPVAVVTVPAIDELALLYDSAACLTFDLIKGANTAVDSITGDLDLSGVATCEVNTTITFASTDVSIMTNAGSFVSSGVYADTTFIMAATIATANESTVKNFVLETPRTLNTAPVANAASVSTDEDTDLTITLSATDTDGDNLTYAVTQPANGTVTLTGNTVVYSPNANYNGTDTIEFTVTDDWTTPATGTAAITVTVNAVNDAPTVSAIADVSVNEDTATAAIAFSVNDVDTGDTLAVTAASSNQAVVADADIVLGGSGADRTVTVTPVAQASGTAEITITVNDGTVGVTETFTLTVTAVNDVPTITAIADQTVDEDVATAAIGFTVGDIETLPASLVVTATSSDQNVVADSGITLGGTADARTVTVIPVPDANGAAVVTVTVGDGVDTVSKSFTVTVNAVNDAPTAQGVASGIFQTKVSVALNGDLNSYVNDVDGDALTFATTGTLGLTLNPDGTFTFTSGSEGTYTFDYTVSDGTLTSAPATVIIDVVAYITPVATDVAASTDEDTAVTIDLASNVTAGDSALDLTTLVVSQGVNGAVVDNGDGTVTYTPSLNTNGVDSFSYSISDAQGYTSNTANVTVTVNTVDDAPVMDAIADITVNESGTGSVTVNAVDPEGDTIIYSASASNSNVSVSVSGSVITVTPVAVGTSVVTVTATAGLLSDSETFTVTVTADPVSSDTTWYNGKTMHAFWIDDWGDQPQPTYEDFTLSSGTITSNEYVFDLNQTLWTASTASDDLFLNTATGAWEPAPSPETYTLSTDGTIMTLNGIEEIRIDSVTALDNVEINITSESGTMSIPVTFSTGAIKYNLSWKQLVDQYELAWQPTVWGPTGDTGVPYSTLEDYMNQNGGFYWDEGSQVGVVTKKNLTGDAAVDINGVEIGTLTLGETGPLVLSSDNSTVVGTWRVINLPGQSTLSVVGELNTGIANYAIYMQYGEQMATLYSGTVYMAEFRPAMTAFEPDDQDYIGNDQALADIKAAIEGYDFSGGSTPLTLAADMFGGYTTTIDYSAPLSMTVSGTCNVDGTFSNSVGSGTWEIVGGTQLVLTFTDMTTMTLEFYTQTTGTYTHSSLGSGTFNITQHDPIVALNDAMFSDKNVTLTLSGDVNLDVAGLYYSDHNFTTDTMGDGTWMVNGNVFDMNFTSGAYVGVVSMEFNDTTYSAGTWLHTSGAAGTFVVNSYTDLYGSTTVSFSSDTRITSDQFIAVTHDDANVAPMLSDSPYWGIWAADDYESVEINSTDGGATGTLTFTNYDPLTDQPAVGTVPDQMVYSHVTDPTTLLSGTMIEVGDGTNPYLYAKFYGTMDQTSLITRYPDITFRTGAAGVNLIHYLINDEFEWWDGDFAVVNYATFDSMITGMTPSNYPSGTTVSDQMITGSYSGVSLLFADGSAGLTSGTVVSVDASTGTVVNPNAGTFEYVDLNGVTTTLVVTVTDSNYSDERIGFQLAGDGTTINRGDVMYAGEGWDEIWFNTTAKEDILLYLNP